MTDGSVKIEDTGPGGSEGAAEPLVSEKSGFSLVWLIPLVAALVAAWLVYHTFAETGPLVTVSFKDASGIEAGKTKVRLKDVVVGAVESVKLGPNLENVLVGVRMGPDSKRLLAPGTSWWVVRPRITSREISGLSTLISGAHIEMVPGDASGQETFFEGLEAPPVVTSGEAGKEFRLVSETLGSLDVGAPIYYRRIPVGYVTGHKLRADGTVIDIDIFIRAPYDKLVRKNTHFWNASGISVDAGADGVKIRTESLISLLTGGIAFDHPNGELPGEPPKPDKVYTLFLDRASGTEDNYSESLRYIAYFGGSVRGLSAKAPVEFRGVQVGKVERIFLEQSKDTGGLRIAVLLNIQPQRVGAPQDENRDPALQISRMVRNGLRAQIRTASLVTGSRFVGLDMYPGDAPAKVVQGEQYPILPTVPETLVAITARLSSLLDKFDKLPLQDIAEELHGAIAGINKFANAPEIGQALERLNASMGQLERFGVQVNDAVIPSANTTLRQATRTMKTAEGVIGPDSNLHHEILKALKDLSAAARSIRNMAEYLERHPDSLLRGKSSRR